MQFLALIVGAVVVEGIIDYVQMIFKEGRFQWQKAVSIILGILIAITYQIDLFDMLGVPAVIPYIGLVLTGILLSRGSNYIFDLIRLISEHTKNLTLRNKDLTSIER